MSFMEWYFKYVD